MKYILLILSLVSLSAIGQDYVRVIHGSVIWMVNSAGTDSTQVSSGDKSGYSIVGHYHPISKITGLQAALDAKGTSNFDGIFSSLTAKPTTLSGYGITDGVANTITVNGHALSGNVNVTTTDLSLNNVNNTSDANKPVSTAQQTALDLKANLASPTFTGTVGGITASMVGLGNVTNESKSTMFASPTFTGTVTIPSSQITNTMLAGSIAYSKLSLTGAILNADLAGSIAEGKFGFTDIITANATTSAHGLLPKLSNNATQYLNGTGGYSTPSNVNSTITFLSGDVTNSNASANTIADVTALSFAVTSGVTYRFKFFIVYTSAATTTGSRWAINGPSTTFLNYTSRYTITATTETVNYIAAYDSPAASNASSLSTNNIAIIEGIIKPSANGTVIARFASEISSSAIVAKAAQSYVEFQAIN